MPPPSPSTRPGANSVSPAGSSGSEIDFEAFEAGGGARCEADRTLGDAVMLGQEFDGGLVRLAFDGGGAHVQLQGAVVEGFDERALTAVRFYRCPHHCRHLILLSRRWSRRPSRYRRRPALALILSELSVVSE